MRRYLLIVTLLSATLSHAQQFKATLDSNQILIGEQVIMRLTATHSAQDTLVWPQLLDTFSTQVEIVEALKIDTTFDQNDITIKTLTQDLLITSFDSGFWAIPPVVFVLNGDSFETEPHLLAVNTVQVDTTQAIYDIKQPLDVEYGWRDWLSENWHYIAWGIAIVGALFALLLALLWHKRRKPEKQIIVQTPTQPPHVIALGKLHALQSEKLWQNGKMKKYHSELSDIVREYIEHRFQVNALEQTTDEIVYNMRTAEVTEEAKARLTQMLRLADLVKFAKEKPIAVENEQSFSNAEEFIKMTIPIVQPQNPPVNQAS